MQPPLAALGFTRGRKNLLLVLFFLSAQAIAQPPVTPRIPVTDNYFGMKVTDHYRWMENLQDSSMMKWFEAQDAYTENIFNRINGRDELLARSEEHTSELQSQSNLVCRLLLEKKKS